MIPAPRTVVALFALAVATTPAGAADSIATFTLRDAPNLGSTVAGETLRLGGFSGLLFDGVVEGTARLRFITHTDRGPNGAPVELSSGSGERRPFALPSFQPEIVVIEADPADRSIKVVRRIGLVRGDGTPLTGRGNVQGTPERPLPHDEAACDLLGRSVANDPFGVDLEGIARAHDGTYWLCDEYRPSLLHVSQDGRLLERFVPEGSNRHGENAWAPRRSESSSGLASGMGTGLVPELASSELPSELGSRAGGPSELGTEALPAVLATRRQNRGFEGIAIVGDRVYAILQSPLDNPRSAAGPVNAEAKPAKLRSRVVRIVEFDTSARRTIGVYAYLLEGQGSDKIGDATATPDGDLLILERDDRRGPDSQKRIFRVDVRGATNLLLLDDSIAGLGGALESASPEQLASLGVVPVSKTLVADLARLGAATVEKLEGLALLPDGRLAVINDDDFGLSGSFEPSNGRLTPNATPDRTILFVIGP